MSDDPYDQARRPAEASDASIRVIGLTAAGIFALIVAGLAMGLALGGLRSGDRRLANAERFRHGPDELPEVAREWPAIDREVHERLDTYGWIDRGRGVVKIPIEEAMKRLAEPDRPP